MFLILGLISLLVWYAVVTVIVAVTILMLLRALVTRADMNPFGWLPLNVRRMTDPLVNPVRRGLARSGLDPKVASLVTVLLVIVLGYFAVKLTEAVLEAIGGIANSILLHAPVRLFGSVLYGVLSIYILLIFMRIVLSWGASSMNRLLRLLVRLTEPILAPFRRLIPPLGMFDISPIIVILLLQLLQEAVKGTLLAR
jgi:YggT family protein